MEITSGAGLTVLPHDVERCITTDHRDRNVRIQPPRGTERDG